MGATTASRLGAALRSWLREERSSGPLSAGQRLMRRLAVALGLLGVGLVLQLQVQHQQRGRLADQQEALSILRAKVLASKQTARDWAQWTEMYDYVARPAAQPTFPDRKIRTANQFAAGGTMLVFNLQDRLLFSADRHGLNRPETQRLASCIQPALAQLISVQDALFFLCDNGRGVPYVGAVTPITDSQATAAANGALAYLVPLEDELIPERSRRLLRQLRHDLYALPHGQTQPPTGLIQPLRPNCSSGCSRPMAAGCGCARHPGGRLYRRRSCKPRRRWPWQVPSPWPGGSSGCWSGGDSGWSCPAAASAPESSNGATRLNSSSA